ncbi:receptor-like protein EIX2 [Bidens hawaiensis]|uniref:receptor-like protein EIX2 n=1 Tax=Bidens hawaiensis TaxID=980011 RepID=UPI004049BAF6
MGNQLVLGLPLIFLSIFFLQLTMYTCLGAQNSTVSCHEREILALLEFKHSIKDDFKVLSSWIGVDCCSWKGVLSDAATGSVVSLLLRGNYMGVFENQNVDYYSVDYYLVGYNVNTHLAELRDLKHLDLSGNYFKGSQIPEFFGSFPKLSYLNLSDAGFDGIIPHQIGNLSNLKILDLGSTFVIQTLNATDMTWISGLSALKHLDLDGVELSQAKNINMVLYKIPSLTYLSLRGCRLSNIDLGPHLNSTKILPNIEHLDLSLNSFEGQLPRFFQNLTSLTVLDLSCNHLNMAWNSINMLNLIPSLSELHLSECALHNAPFSPTYFNFSVNSKIQYLDISRNSIGGRFPSDLMNMTSLRVLDLSENSLNSSIPVMPNLLKLDVSFNLKELSSLSGLYHGEELISPSTNTSECSQYALEMLDLYFSNLNGSIPESLGHLSKLKFLHLKSNYLTGPIPKALERLRSLEVLDLSYNDLTSPIPAFLGKLTKLYLAENQFSGSIPKSLGSLTGLTHLSLESNQLTGSIPISIGRLSKLVIFDVSNNSLKGVVSEAHFANLSMLKYLHTTSNHKLIFNISHEWIPPFQLIEVELGSCKIANGFPQWLQNQRKLKNLVLSNASVYGFLPTWLRKMAIIKVLNLSHNKLSGSLINLPIRDPINEVESDPIEILLLQDNLFNGQIPRSLCTKTRLILLDVSTNKLSGNIPDCVENLQTMVTLILSSNELSGVLPSSLGNISSLARLKLNDNNFSGQLPQDLGNLISLRILDLGNNKISGNIPKWIGENLAYLMVLGSSKNNFTGNIPLSLCKCSFLQILDVAYNNLTGLIPCCFGELKGMIEARQPDMGPHKSVDEEMDMVNVNQVMKGTQLEYTKTLGLVFNMDLSSNKLKGGIPFEMTRLIMLVGLNLSHNHLNGSIPDSIEKMKALISLDFSDNQFTGMIPPSMATLNFLSSLNLSHNNLSGPIPTGNQLQTLTDPSIYAGNRDLCGAPLPNNCSNHDDPITATNKTKYKDSGEHEEWFYLSVMCGLAAGFWGVIGVLLFKKQ